VAATEVEKARRRAYYLANREVIKARTLTYYYAHREVALAKMKKRYWADPEARREYTRQYNLLHPERMARYRLDNAEALRQHKAEYDRRPENAERIRQYNRDHYERNKSTDDYKARRLTINTRRRIQKLGGGAGVVDTIEIAKLVERDGWTCKLCGRAINPLLTHGDLGYRTVDHVIPLALGGEHSYANTQLAHMRCNMSKGSRATVPDVTSIDNAGGAD
jgi:5-methylcytosine-specific restriction endonuclease McrA